MGQVRSGDAPIRNERLGERMTGRSGRTGDRCGLCRRPGRWQQQMPPIGPICDGCADHVHAQARRAG